jgi:hypothetical protein
MRPGEQQRGAGPVPSAVVLNVPFCPEPDETEWSGLGNQTVQFGNYRELASASVLVSTFTSGTLSCSLPPHLDSSPHQASLHH